MTKRELATVLAALRYWQQDLETNDEPPISEEFFADCAPLTSEEIDGLCERLNSETASSEAAPGAMSKAHQSARIRKPKVVRVPKARTRGGKSRR
jgi:hypothetical protein